MDLVNETTRYFEKNSSFTGNHIVLIYKYLTKKYANKNFKKKYKKNNNSSCSLNSYVKAGWTKGSFWKHEVGKSYTKSQKYMS